MLPVCIFATQEYLLPLLPTSWGVYKLFPSRTVVTLREFSTVHFFAQMTNIVTSFSSCRLGFHTCGLCTVYTEVINIPYSYLISRVLNFAILSKPYFARLYFRDFDGQK